MGTTNLAIDHGYDPFAAALAAANERTSLNAEYWGDHFGRESRFEQMRNAQTPPRERGGMGVVDVPKVVEAYPLRSKDFDRRLRVYIPTPVEAQWAEEHLPKRYSNDPEYPVKPAIFERNWVAEHSRHGTIDRDGDRLELSFGTYRLHENDPLDITQGLLSYSGHYDGLGTWRKMGPFFHRTCVAPKVELPPKASPREWLLENVRVAYGLGLAVTDPVHPYFFNRIYEPMAAKAVNRVPDDHEKKRPYHLSEKQKQLLDKLEQEGTALHKYCPEAVYVALECAEDIAPAHFEYAGAQDHFRHWPNYFRNGLLPQRHAELIHWLAKKGRVNPLQDSMRFCEALYGQKSRAPLFKEDVDFPALIKDHNVDAALLLAEELGMGFEEKFEQTLLFRERLQAETKLQKETIKRLSCTLVGSYRSPARALQMLDASIQMLAPLGDAAQHAAVETIIKFLSNYDDSDSIVGMLEVDDGTVFRLPVLEKMPKEHEECTALVPALGAGLVQVDGSKDPWSSRSLTLALAPGTGVPADASLEVFDLYERLRKASSVYHSGYGNIYRPIEQEYFAHLAPHLRDPLRPSLEALGLLHKCKGVCLPSRTLKMDVCLYGTRWVEEKFGYCYSYDEERKKNEDLQQRAYDLLGKMMDLSRLDIFTEAQVVELMNGIFHEPIGHGAPELNERDRRIGIEQMKADDRSNLTDRDWAWHVGLNLNKRIVLAKLLWLESVFPAINNLSVLAHSGCFDKTLVRNIVLREVGRTKKQFCYRDSRQRLDPSAIFDRKKHLDIRDIECLKGASVDWSALLKDEEKWVRLPEYAEALGKWLYACEYAINQLERERLVELYKNPPEFIQPENSDQVLRGIDVKRWERSFYDLLGGEKYDEARVFYDSKPEELCLEPIEEIVSRNKVAMWHDKFKSLLFGYNTPSFDRIKTLYEDRPEGVDESPIPRRIYEFLEMVENRYAWVRATPYSHGFDTRIRTVCGDILKGKVVHYGPVHLLGDKAEASVQITAVIEDSKNRATALALISSATSETVRERAGAILENARGMDAAALEVFLDRLTKAPSTEVALFGDSDPQLNLARFRRNALPQTGAHALDTVNAAIWSATQHALMPDKDLWVNPDRVNSTVESLKEAIRRERIQSFGLPPLGSKIHMLEPIDPKVLARLMEIAGLRSSGFRMDRNTALLLPAVPSGGELGLLVSSLSTVGDLRQFLPQLQLCIGTRLPKEDAAVLGIAVMLASQEVRLLSQDYFMTSHDRVTAGRVMVYDAGGGLSGVPFTRKVASVTKGRTDMLARFAAKDPYNYQLVGGVLADGVLGGEPFSDFAGPWKEQFKQIIGDHGLEHVLDDTWVFAPDVDKDSADTRLRHFNNVSAVTDAYLQNVAQFEATGLYEGVVFDVRTHLQSLADQIRPRQQEMLASSTYCKEVNALLNF